MNRSRYVAQAGMIAAVHAGFTLTSILFLQTLAWGPIQLRVSEALTVLALFTPAAIPGLTIGTLLANAIAIPLVGAGPIGLLDVVFGSLATLVGAAFTWRMRKRPLVALLGPVLANALVVAAYLPLLLSAIGFYTIPFTSIELSRSYPLMYLFGFVAVATGQAIVVYGLGWPLAKLLQRVDFSGCEGDGNVLE